MPRPKVLVLLAAYNGAPWIAEQIASILDQTGVDVDLVVSDDGSKDGTRAVLQEAACDARVTILLREAAPSSAAQNFLHLIGNVDVDGHDFVALSDQDDVWNRDKLHRGCERLTANGASGYSAAVTAFWNDGRERVLEQSARFTRADFLLEGAGQGCTFVLSYPFYRRIRGFVREHGSLTGDLRFHDWAIYALCRAWGLAWDFDPLPCLRYRQHGGNDTGARASLGGIRRRVVLIRSGWYSRQLAVIAGICEAAAPHFPVLGDWRSVLATPPGISRRWRFLGFLSRGGRRRRSDNAALVIAAAFGWI